jgi:hypothetical protein
MKSILILCTIFSMVHFSFAQQNTKYFWVKGKVVQADNKQPLLGASVYAENTTLGTTTDQDGNFALQLYEGGYGLVVSFAGVSGFLNQTTRSFISKCRPKRRSCRMWRLFPTEK